MLDQQICEMEAELTRPSDKAAYGDDPQCLAVELDVNQAPLSKQSVLWEQKLLLANWTIVLLEDHFKYPNYLGTLKMIVGFHL